MCPTHPCKAGLLVYRIPVWVFEGSFGHKKQNGNKNTQRRKYKKENSLAELLQFVSCLGIW